MSLDVDRLRAWLAQAVPDASGPLRVEQLSGGSSNLTFRVRDDANDWVLRRPPASHVLATAHDVGREHLVQSALAASDVPVPRMVAWCGDLSVLGVPFYVMERVDGVVYSDVDAVAHVTEADARAATDRLVDVLAAVHAVDVHAVGLGDLGRPDAFVERQVARWRTQWSRSRADGLDVVDEVGDRLASSLPPAQAPTLVHGDFSFNNTMWSRSRPAEMVALLDWEMATLGDPLCDLGLLTAYWGDVGAVLWRNRARQAHRANPGFPPVDAVVARYAAASGRRVDALGFYQALATFKLAVITAGAAARLADAAPDRAASAREVTGELAVMALEMTRRPGPPRPEPRRVGNT